MSLVLALSSLAPVMSAHTVNAAGVTKSVCADTCDYTTIVDAVADVNAGDTLEIRAGVYTASNVSINKPLTITGQSGAVIQVPDVNNTNAFDVWANDVTINNLTIVGPADGTSYLSYAWGGTVTRGIAVHNGAMNFAITNNVIKGLRNNILIDGRNTGSITGNTIDNSKSGISVQYTDAGTGNSEGYTITISGNNEGTFGNEWGLNTHLNGHYEGATYFNNAQKIATNATSGVQQSLTNNSVANDGWTVQDQGYSQYNRTAVTVSNSGSDSSQGSPLGPLATLHSAVTAVVSGGTVELASDLDTASQVTVKQPLTLDGKNHKLKPVFAKTDNGNNSALGIQSDNVTVKRLVVDGVGGTNLHGVNVFESSNVKLNKVTSKNNDRSGVSINSSTVTVNNITTANNGWHGINVDKPGAVLRVKGVSSHTNELFDIYVDDATLGQVIDMNNQYSVSTPHHNGQPDDRSYDLKPGTPTLLSPENNSYSTANDFYFDWETVPGAAEYEFQSSQNPAATDGVLTTGVWNNKANGGSDQNHLTDSAIHSYGANGVWYWQVRAIDAKGVKSDWSSIWKMTIDTTVPTTPIINTPSNEQYFNSQPINATWAASTDANGINKYQVEYIYDDGHTFAGGPYREVSGTTTHRNHTPSTGEQGGVTIRVRSMDNAGNYSAWSAPVHYYYDATAPVISDLTLSKVLTNEDHVTVSGTITDSYLKNYKYQIVDSSKHNVLGEYSWSKTGGTASVTNGVLFTADISSLRLDGVNTEALPDGDYYVRVWAEDFAGNKTGISSHVYLPFTVDRTGPVVAADTPEYTAITNVITPAFTATDPNGVVTYSWTTDPNVTLSATDVLNPTFTVNADGDYTFTLTVTDAAGNSTDRVFSFSYATPAAPVDNGSTDNGDGESDGTTNTGFTNVNTGTSNVSDDATDDSDVLGTSTEKDDSNSDVMGASETAKSDSKGWSLADLAWYWWLAILAVIALIGWLISVLRRRAAGNA